MEERAEQLKGFSNLAALVAGFVMISYLQVTSRKTLQGVWCTSVSVLHGSPDKYASSCVLIFPHWLRSQYIQKGIANRGVIEACFWCSSDLTQAHRIPMSSLALASQQLLW